MRKENALKKAYKVGKEGDDEASSGDDADPDEDKLAEEEEAGKALGSRYLSVYPSHCFCLCLRPAPHHTLVDAPSLTVSHRQHPPTNMSAGHCRHMCAPTGCISRACPSLSVCCPLNRGACAGAGFAKVEKRVRTTAGGASGSVRNLRIREDTAKYLLNLDTASAHYDPKSRSMREDPQPSRPDTEKSFRGDNHVRQNGDYSVSLPRTALPAHVMKGTGFASTLIIACMLLRPEKLREQAGGACMGAALLIPAAFCCKAAAASPAAACCM